MPYSQRTSVILLSLIEFLERFSYYGMRALILLFAIDVLKMDNQLALSIYGKFTILIFIIPLPAGIISDALFKQKQGVLYGGMIALLGYILLITEQMQMVGLGLILIAVGTGLVKPNLTVLVGRLFEKTDKNRDFAFMFYYFVINIAAFISIVVVGILGEKYGYKYGFMITALATLIYLILFFLTKEHLQMIEKNVDEKYLEANNENDDVLDFELTQSKSPNASPNILIAIVIIMIVLFWQIFELISTEIHSIISGSTVITFDNEVFNPANFQIFNSSLLLLITIIFFIIWYFRGLGSTIIKFAFAMILMGVAAMIIVKFNALSVGNIIPLLGITVLLYTVAETLISSFSISYITRLGNVKYSSTIVGCFMFLTGIGSRILYYFSEGKNSAELLISLSFILITIGLLLIFFRKKLLKMSGGID